MAERLLVIEDAFTAQGRGVLVTPRFTAASPQKGKRTLQLRFASGATRDVTAEMDVAHMRGALPPYAMYRLHDVTVEELAPGTELWSIDELT